MNSEEALGVVGTLIDQGKVVRVSAPERVSKGIVFRTASGRHFAVELNTGAACDPARQTKVVFEKMPGSLALDWPTAAAMKDVLLSDDQFQRTLYQLRGANLEAGKQMAVRVASEAALEQLIGWYADAVLTETPMPVPERAAVEAAMARYDELGQAGVAAAYPGLNGPVDSWVRPSRQRAHDRYPSKVIAVFALGTPSIEDGWATPGAAASLLHNRGYIIVDEAGRPAPVPSSEYPYLITGANRIRACALTNYIAPARDCGDANVEIVVGKLHNEMGLFQSWANVYQSLGGKLFIDYASVAAPDRHGPVNSPTATFTYHLQNATTTMSLPVPVTTNLILYGPPGTGKTYESAAAAVRLCLGDEAAQPLLAQDRRGDLMETYHKLAEAGRIEFITFHQSYSYEDFVEGLRPTTNAVESADDGDLADGDDDGVEAAPATGGFRLCSRDGVFKRICERARLDLGGARDGQQLDRERSIFKIALGRRRIEEDRVAAGLNGNVVHLGWGGDIDWSNERFEDFEEVRREWHEKKNPKASGKDPNIEMTYAFRSDLKIGDYVVVSDGRDTFRAFGKVTGDYYFDSEAPFHPHRRRIEWIWQDEEGVTRNTFYPNYFRRQSVYRLNPAKVDWDALEAIVLRKDTPQVGVGARPYVLVIDEINRANISKVFGELITLLEPDKRLGQVNELRVKLPYSDGPAFGVPPNLHIIGTMNTADRSIALLDTALRRRFAFRELMPKPALLKTVDDIDLGAVLATINERIEYLFDREHQIGHAYFINCKTREDVDEVMRDKVIPLLAEYFYEDWSKVAAVLGDADEGLSDREGGFLDRKKLMAPKGMGDGVDGQVRFRWSVRSRFDFVRLVKG